jgi:methionyl-tRNA synthetase
MRHRDQEGFSYGAHRTCESCKEQFLSDDPHRKIEIREQDDDIVHSAEYFLCMDCVEDRYPTMIETPERSW